MPSAVTDGGGVSKLYPPTKSAFIHDDPGNTRTLPLAGVEQHRPGEGIADCASLLEDPAPLRIRIERLPLTVDDTMRTTVSLI